VGAPGKNRLPLALPQPTGDTDYGDEFYQTVRRDLELSGWFEVIDPAAYIEPKETGLRPGEFQFSDWETCGAAVLGKTGLKHKDSDRLRAEVWVYDVGGARKIGAKAFTADTESVRSLAHRIANEIILRVTGQAGPFNTRFAVSGSFTGNKEIYLVDFDGHGLTRITKNGSINIQPSWSSSGKKVSFTSYAQGNPDLYVADLTQGRINRLSARNGINTGASWNPRADVIALTLSPRGDPDIYTIDSNTGKRLSRLTRTNGIDVSPVFSPDGSKIAFVSERSGGAQIYVMNSDGSNAKRVTFQGGHNTDPVWSPDGESLAFVARDKVFDIFTVKPDGSNLTRITQGERDNEDPSWSPDGHYIGFSSTRTGSSHIWMSTKDGTHQVQLTQGSGGYTNPAWSPTLTW